MRLRQSAASLVARTRIGRWVLEDRRRRAVFFAAVSLGCNLLYALYHGVLGILGMSLWLITMCAFYGVLAAMRFAAVLCGRRGGEAPVSREYFVMELTGVLLALLSVILSAVVYLSLSRNIAVRYGEIVMITIAAYTFYKITAAVVRAVRQRRNPSPLLAAIRGISYAEVAASVLTLQRSMLVSFGAMSAGNIHLMNALTGAGVCLFVLLLGISMIIKGRKGEKLCRNQSL